MPKAVLNSQEDCWNGLGSLDSEDIMLNAVGCTVLSAAPFHSPSLVTMMGIMESIDELRFLDEL